MSLAKDTNVKVSSTSRRLLSNTKITTAKFWRLMQLYKRYYELWKYLPIQFKCKSIDLKYHSMATKCVYRTYIKLALYVKLSTSLGYEKR